MTRLTEEKRKELAAFVRKDRLSPEAQKQRDGTNALLAKEGMPPIEEFTCDKCAARDNCEFSFEPYNTDGDCLADK